MKWLTLEADDDWKVVMPDEDIKPHGFPKDKEDTEIAWIDCPCKPRVDALRKIIVHNSFSDIEKIEESLKNLVS